MALLNTQGHSVLPRGQCSEGTRSLATTQGWTPLSFSPSLHQCWMGGSQGGLSASCHPGQDRGCLFSPLVACSPQELLSLCSSQNQEEAASSSPQQGIWDNCLSTGIHLLFPEAGAKLSIKAVSREARGDRGTTDRQNMRSWCLSSELWGKQGKPKLGGQSCPQPEARWQQPGQDRGPPGWVHCPLTVPIGWVLVGWIRQYHSSLRW